MPTCLRTPSLWIACAGIALALAGPRLPGSAAVPAATILILAVRWSARREGRREGELAAYDLTKAEATGQLIRRRAF